MYIVLSPSRCVDYHVLHGDLQVEASSYREIGLSLGVDSGEEIMFATDIYAEAVAAKKAGWNAVLVTRPGNKPLPANARQDFRIIENLEDLLPMM